MLRPGGSFKRIEANPSAGTDQTSTATATPPLLTRIMPGWRSLIDHKRYAGSVAASRTKVALTARRFGFSSRPRINVPLTASRTPDVIAPMRSTLTHDLRELRLQVLPLA